jgi:hypothetical protein
MKRIGPPILRYRSPEAITKRGHAAMRNQAAAAIDSIWFIMKRAGEWLYELSRWLR